MNYNRSLTIGLILVLASFVLTVWLYPHIPEPVPGWNGSKALFAFLIPAIAAFKWALLALLPRIAPRGFRLDQFLDLFGILGTGIILVLSLLNAIILLQEAGYVLPLPAIVPVAVGVLMIFFGNYMGKLRKNFFIGFRTPWTLASDEVWARTHRFGGWLFVLSGLVIAADGMLGANIPIVVVAVLCAAFAPLVYSFVLYRRIEGFGPDPSA